MVSSRLSIVNELAAFGRSPDEDERLLDILLLLEAASNEGLAKECAELLNAIGDSKVLNWRHEVPLGDYLSKRRMWVVEVVDRDKNLIPMDPFRYGAVRIEHIVAFVHQAAWSSATTSWIQRFCGPLSCRYGDLPTPVRTLIDHFLASPTTD